jgi:NADH:ubiquinone oxidoreductase subunit 5 (subunit L)/multisubunit Na+/H+ antiporter MnhA subunit
MKHALDHTTEWMLMGISTGIGRDRYNICMDAFSKKPDTGRSHRVSEKCWPNKWYVDEFYNASYCKTAAYALASLMKCWREKTVIDGLVNGVGRISELRQPPGAIIAKRPGGKLCAADGAEHAVDLCGAVLPPEIRKPGDERVEGGKES